MGVCEGFFAESYGVHAFFRSVAGGPLLTGSIMYLNGQKAVNNDNCHAMREKSSAEIALRPGRHKLEVRMCEAGGGEGLQMKHLGLNWKCMLTVKPQHQLHIGVKD